MKRKNNTLLSLVLPAVLCTALWGSAAPCVKKGYELFEIAAGDSFSQLVFAGWRFTLAGVLVLLVAACMGHRIRPKRGEYRAIFMISLFQSMLQYVCYYIGLAGTTGTKASVLSGTQTFFALLLAHALLENDRLTRRKTLGCVLGFAGVLVLSAAAFTIWTALLGRFPVGRVSLFGFLIPVFGAVFSALVLGENIMTVRNLLSLLLVSGGIALANSAAASSKS
ncbi:DMT family transporter [Agathobaculum sp.]|uniref:DMT family transporter n=1 Tax=Agathobaculum sp. TaxID=2048138 RepID=UPI00305E5490